MSICLLLFLLVDGIPQISYFSMPHPSGIVFDKNKELLYVASTRNPNQIYDLAPVDKLVKRLDIDQHPPKRTTSSFLFALDFFLVVYICTT